MEEKVKCKLCGKVGLAKDEKGLIRHLHLVHNTCVSKKCNLEPYYEQADPDSIIEIRSVSPKAFRKSQNKKWKQWKRGPGGHTLLNEKQYVRIIYTPMTNG